MSGDANVLAHALLMRRGDGAEAIINPCVALYVWDDSGNVAQAASRAANELVRVRPDVVIPHGGTADLLANLPRAMHLFALTLDDTQREDVRYWVGIGIDGMLAAWHRGELTSAQVVARHVQVAKLLAGLGLEAAVLNGEGKWALVAGSVRTVADVRALAAAIGRAYQEHAPTLVLLLSSYGRLGMHASIRALIEGLTPFCSGFTGQSYAARVGEVRRGVLPTILELDERSQAATVKQGWMRGDAPGDAHEGDTADDLDRLPTVQAHKTDATDLCTALCERSHVAAWSAPTIREGGRADEEGLAAIEAALRIRREVGPDPGAVRRVHAAHGLTVDGRAGPITRRVALAGTT